MRDLVSAQAFISQQALYANVQRICRKCGAPGFWHNVDPNINPGCYAPEKVTQLGNDPVGPICPNCGAKRGDGPDALGEIWKRSYRPGVWPVVKAAIYDVGRRLKPRSKRKR